MRVTALLCVLLFPAAVCGQCLSLDLVSQEGATVTVALTMHDIPEGQAGYQAFVQFDRSLLQFTGGSYATDLFGVPLYDPIVAAEGQIALAAGIDLMSGQPPAGGSAVLAYLTFERLKKAGTVLALPDHSPATEFADEEGNALLPKRVDLKLE